MLKMRRITAWMLMLICLLAAGAWAETLPEPGEVDRARAEEIVQEAYPGCRILFARDEGAYKCIGIVAEEYCGSVLVSAEGIYTQSLKEDTIMRDGMLTMAGAIETMRLHRPEAEFRAIELDEDDGMLIYEGDALFENVVYEFELDAASGKLLEWERDD